jgi:ABC-2 type transport system ATP-binding protein
VLAEGNVFAIRGLIDRHPHRIRVESDEARRLAAAIATADHVARISFEDHAVIVETRDPDACYDELARIVLDEAVPVRSLTSPDNNLGAVFEYLTSKKGFRTS